MSGRYARIPLLAFALANAALYACFLPLWEGFDEPFHYAYVQSLSEGQLPVFGKAKVSAEIYQSFATTPVSRFLSGTTHTPSFEEWFTLPAGTKRRDESRRAHIPTFLRGAPATLDNYEAQQAPLAYTLLVPFDAALSRVQLRWRVLALRLIAATAAALLLYLGLNRLCEVLRMPGPFALGAMVCVFGSQMLWATVAHIGNDFLAVPLTLLFLSWLALSVRSGRARDMLILSGLFAAGLLTKAYFLAFAPVFLARACLQFRKKQMRASALLALLIPVAAAGPWYWRNQELYGSFTGTQQAVAGIGFPEALSAIPKIPWVSSTLAFLHWSLWTGNWSFLSFSKTTLNLELALLAVGLVLYFACFRRITAAEWWALAACACFMGGLVYQTCVTYIHTRGASLFAEPWYWQGVVCFLWVIVFRGLLQSGVVGRAGAIATVLLSAWIVGVTYVAKLFPLYGGGFQRATLSRVWAWWHAHPTQDLKLVALAPPLVLYALLTLLLSIAGAQTCWIVAGLMPNKVRE